MDRKHNKFKERARQLADRKIRAGRTCTKKRGKRKWKSTSVSEEEEAITELNYIRRARHASNDQNYSSLWLSYWLSAAL